MTSKPPATGPSRCPDCAAKIMLAIFWNGTIYALDEDPAGQVAVIWEAGHPRCRPVMPGDQLRLGETLYSPHVTSCVPPGTPLATIHDLDSRRAARPASPSGRTTHAR